MRRVSELDRQVADGTLGRFLAFEGLVREEIRKENGLFAL